MVILFMAGALGIFALGAVCGYAGTLIGLSRKPKLSAWDKALIALVDEGMEHPPTE